MAKLNLSPEQQLQEDKYLFPYHYIVSFKNSDFCHYRVLDWGYIYASYIKFVISQIKKKRPFSILDVGCGAGRFLFYVRKNLKNVKLTGIDYSSRAILFAKAFCPDIEFILGDILNDDLLREKYDIITLIEVLEHIPSADISFLLKRISEKINNDGFLFVTVPSKNKNLNPKHYQHFDLNSLRQMLEPQFRIENTYFLNKMCFWDNLIKTILTNKYFILRNKKMLSILFRIYEKFLLLTNENKSMRIFVICKKVDPEHIIKTLKHT